MGCTKSSPETSCYAIPHKTHPAMVPTTNVEGQYECHLYDNGGKNDWHYVTIHQEDASMLVWTNRAGVSWNLFFTSSNDCLQVGKDCPYFEKGHTAAKILYSNQGGIAGVLGPWGELYTRSA